MAPEEIVVDLCEPMALQEKVRKVMPHDVNRIMTFLVDGFKSRDPVPRARRLLACDATLRTAKELRGRSDSRGRLRKVVGGLCSALFPKNEKLNFRKLNL
jgi:hypothetical protein